MVSDSIKNDSKTSLSEQLLGANMLGASSFNRVFAVSQFETHHMFEVLEECEAA